MRLTNFSILAAAAMVAACGSSEPTAEPGEALSGEEVADRARAAVKPEPGQYRVSVEILEVDIPGAPAGVAEMMRDMMAGQSHEYCLTSEDVEKGYEEMARQSQEGSDCQFQSFNVSGGDIDAAMTCDSEEGGMTMTLDGTATPTRSDMNMTMKGNMSGMGNSTIRMKAAHERIGDCPA